MSLDEMIQILTFKREDHGHATLWEKDLDAVLAFLIAYKELVDGINQEMKSNTEAANHPAHYQGKRECIEVMRAMFGDNAVMGFCKCNSFKYRFRQDGKGGAEDVQNAEWYEDYLIQMQKEHEEQAVKIWNHT